MKEIIEVKQKKKSGYQDRILECLTAELYGLTIKDIALKIGGNRNTVSKYLNILEAKEKVFKQEIGTAILYFAKERRAVPLELVFSFYKALLGALKSGFPNQEAFFKTLGKLMIDYDFFPLNETSIKSLKSFQEKSKTSFFKLFGEQSRKYFEYLFDKLEPRDVMINEEKNHIIYHFRNSDLLKDDGEYIYHFYLIIGYLEAKLSRIFKKEVKCDVVSYKVSHTEDDENYIIIMIKF